MDWFFKLLGRALLGWVYFISRVERKLEGPWLRKIWRRDRG